MHRARKKTIISAAIAGAIIFLVFVPLMHVSTTYTAVYNIPGGHQLVYWPDGCVGSGCFGVETTNYGSITYYLFRFGGVLNQSSIGQIVSPLCAPQCYHADPNSSRTSYVFGLSSSESSEYTNATIDAHCYPLNYPQYSVQSVPSTWSYSSCVVAVGESAAGRSPEISYTLSAPYSVYHVSSTPYVNATVVARYNITISFTNPDTSEPVEGYAEPINSTYSDWKVSIPFVSSISIDVFNNSTQNNPFTMNFLAY